MTIMAGMVLLWILTDLRLAEETLSIIQKMACLAVTLVLLRLMVQQQKVFMHI